MKFFIIFLILFSGINLYAKKELSLGAGALGTGIGFRDDIGDDSYKITGFTFITGIGDDYQDKYLDISLQYNYTIKKHGYDNLYLLLGGAFFYYMEYSGSSTDYKKKSNYKGVMGFGLNSLFFDKMTLTFEIYQVIQVNNSSNHFGRSVYDEGSHDKSIYTYPSVSFFIGFIF